MNKIDLVCLGRAGVDLYAEQVGSRLEDVGSFAKYIGGSSTNIACCSARMGLKSALITRVGDEPMGQFITEQLQREGVDTRNVITDPQRLTALVILGIKDKDTFPLVFYRENCADMALSIDDIDEALIQHSQALLITGTHFSTESVYRTSDYALDVARAASVKTVLDIDYRPVLWGLTSRGDGETRFVASESVTTHLQSILGKFDLVVGTEEEIHIAGGSTDTITALKNIRLKTDAVLVLKRGPYGASVYEGDIPVDLDRGVTVQGVTVEVLNVLGAGDAFMSGFLRGWINDEGYEQALRYANACGALVVSRHGCTPAMPTCAELDYYLENAAQIPRPDIDAELNYLHRVTTRPDRVDALYIHAFDHRAPCGSLADAAAESSAKISRLQSLLHRATLRVTEQRQLHGKTGILCDGRYGQDVLNAATGAGLWIARPIEQPGSRPLAFEGNHSAGSTLKTWPLEHRVTCRVVYSTGDPAQMRGDQELRIKELYEACCRSGHELMLEVIPPDESVAAGRSVLMSIERLLTLGVRADWWQIPCIDMLSAREIDRLIRERSPYCRGIVVHGPDTPATGVDAGFKAVSGLAGIIGFSAGPAVFSEPATRWLAGSLSDTGLMEEVASLYSRLIDNWQQA